MDVPNVAGKRDIRRYTSCSGSDRRIPFVGLNSTKNESIPGPSTRLKLRALAEEAVENHS